MVWIGSIEIKMKRGWVVQYKDGRVICEDEMPWIKVPNKRDIRRVILKWEDRIWSFDDKENYTAPKTRGYVDVNSIGIAGEGIDSRMIGYYDTEENCKVWMRVDETTGQMSYETEEIK
ncbi:hypothetical protein KA005_75690 [bacterium]|nr:hypothetical protein [bacterium]